MSEAGLDIFDEGYVHQFQPGPNTQFNSNSRSTEFKDILLWNISQMITKTIPIGTRTVISYVMKWGISFWVWWKVSGKRQSHEQNFPMEGSHCRAKASIKKEVNPKEQDCAESFGDLCWKVDHLSKVISGYQVYQFNQSRLACPYDEVSKNKRISRWVDWENLIYVRQNSIKNCA